MPPYTLRGMAVFLLGLTGLLLSVQAQAAPSVSGQHGFSTTSNFRSESLYGSGTLFAKYAKIPLIEGHGSYFEKDVTLMDPVTKQEFSHSEAMLEILNPSMSASLSVCANLAYEWGGDSTIAERQPQICGKSDFLVKVWPTQQNQAKAYACYCVSKEAYQERGVAAEKVKNFSKPVLGQNLSLVKMSGEFTAYRPDGSLVEPSRLSDVYAQDLGPGPVNMNTGSRMRYMRFFLKNSRGEFVPISKSQDLIYQVLDSGLVSSDVPAHALARRSALKRGDKSNVVVDRVSSDMWLRPKFIDPNGNGHLLGNVMQTSPSGEQVKLNSDIYSMPLDLNAEHFGLMNRMRSPERRLADTNAALGVESADEQVIHAPVITRPVASRSRTISAALPIVSDMRTARQTGYYSYNYDDNYVWGRPHVIWQLRQAGINMAARGIIGGIGDINRKPDRSRNRHDSESHAETPGHASHNDGLCADLRLIFSDGIARQGTYHSSGYDAQKTFEMIREIIETDPSAISGVHFNDPKVQKMVRAFVASKGYKIRVTSDARGSMHDNHVHLSWKP